MTMEDDFKGRVRKLMGKIRFYLPTSWSLNNLKFLNSFPFYKLQQYFLLDYIKERGYSGVDELRRREFRHKLSHRLNDQDQEVLIANLL